MIFRKCPACGANLDPGEQCDCGGVEQPEAEAAQRPVRKPKKDKNAPYSQDEYVKNCWRRWLEA